MQKHIHLRSLTFALLAFITTIILQFIYRVFVSAGNDLYFPICGAKALLDGADPFNSCPIYFQGREYPQNPMTSILMVLPVSRLANLVGGIVFFSFCVGLLVYGIFENGHVWQLLIFTSYPFWLTFNHLQWSVFLAAIYLLPALLPLSIVKPQLAIPLILTKLTRRRLIGLLTFFLISVAVFPSWLIKWLPQAFSTYNGFIPIAIFPGIFLLLSFMNWKNPEARFLSFMALSPQRGLYDQTSLWLLLKTPAQAIILSVSSWIAFFALKLFPNVYDGIWTVVFIYLPAMIMVVDWHGVMALIPQTNATRLRKMG